MWNSNENLLSFNKSHRTGSRTVAEGWGSCLACAKSWTHPQNYPHPLAPPTPTNMHKHTGPNTDQYSSPLKSPLLKDSCARLQLELSVQSWVHVHQPSYRVQAIPLHLFFWVVSQEAHSCWWGGLSRCRWWEWVPWMRVCGCPHSPPPSA